MCLRPDEVGGIRLSYDRNCFDNAFGRTAAIIVSNLTFYGGALHEPHTDFVYMIHPAFPWISYYPPLSIPTHPLSLSLSQSLSLRSVSTIKRPVVDVYL